MLSSALGGQAVAASIQKRSGEATITPRQQQSPHQRSQSQAPSFTGPLEEGMRAGRHVDSVVAAKRGERAVPLEEKTSVSATVNHDDADWGAFKGGSPGKDGDSQDQNGHGGAGKFAAREDSSNAQGKGLQAARGSKTRDEHMPGKLGASSVWTARTGDATEDILRGILQGDFDQVCMCLFVCVSFCSLDACDRLSLRLQLASFTSSSSVSTHSLGAGRFSGPCVHAGLTYHSRVPVSHARSNQRIMTRFM